MFLPLPNYSHWLLLFLLVFIPWPPVRNSIQFYFIFYCKTNKISWKMFSFQLVKMTNFHRKFGILCWSMDRKVWRRKYWLCILFGTFCFRRMELSEFCDWWTYRPIQVYHAQVHIISPLTVSTPLTLMNFLLFHTLAIFVQIRNLPRAIWIAMPAVTIIYVLVNLAYFAVVSRDEMLSSVAVAVTFGNKVFGPVAWSIPIFVALSCFGGVNGIVFTSARLFATGAQDGNLPSFFSLVHHKQQTPIPSLIFSVSQSEEWIFFSTKKQHKNIKLIKFQFSAHNLIDNALYIGCLPADQLFQPNIMAVSCGQYCCTALAKKDKVICVNCLFSKLFSLITCFFFLFRPDLPRPIRVNLIIPVVFIVLCMILVLLPSLKSPENLIVGILITAAGIPVYYVGVYWKNKPACYQRLSLGIERFCQIMFSTIFVDQEEKDV